MISFKKILKYIINLRYIFIALKDYTEFKKIVSSNSYIFISHNGDSTGGAPIVLLELIKALKSKNTILLCDKPGNIAQLCEKESITCFCTYLIKNKYLKTAIQTKVKSIEINTMTLYNYISYINQFDSSIPVQWWIHESKDLIEDYSKLAPKNIRNNIDILCVSKEVEKNLLTNCPQYKNYTSIFYYCCADNFNKKYTKHHQKKFTISIIGGIGPRKNQLQIIRSYKLLPKDLQKKIVIQFIGAPAHKNYIKKLNMAIKNIKNISLLGVIDRQKMMSIYQNSDLVICSSIDDPLPVVVTEAMMMECPVITSSATGQSSLIQSGINGYVYNVISDEDLAKKIETVYYLDKEDLHHLVTAERETYTKYFSPDSIRNNYTNLVANQVKNI